MKVVVVEPPEPFVTLDEARSQIMELPEEDEPHVEMLIMAATAWIDGPAGWLGRCLGMQTLELTGWSGCGRLKLPFPPVVDIVSVTTEDADGNETVVDGAQYRFARGDLFVTAGASWVREPVHRILYTAGYDEVPAPIRVAILMLVAQWYRTREPVVIGATVETLPFAVEALLAPYRVFS
jgi:uncharacterized phiE125 gp8 family phage protein